jgi:hypothetical protein
MSEYACGAVRARGYLASLASLALLVAVAVLGLPAAASASSGHALPRLDVLVVAGQSNALGYQSYVVDPKTHKDVFTDSSRSAADSRVLLMWTESGVASSGTTPVKLNTPQHLQGAPSPVFGPELGLARELYAAGHHNLLVVKVAFAGSSLAVDWQPGQPDYEALVQRVGQAMTWAQASGWAPSIAGVYWVQGETDAMSASWASSYKANLLQFIRNLRVGLSLSSKTPFVLAETDILDYINFEKVHKECSSPSCSAEKRWNSEVMKGQAACASKYVFVAETASLPRVEDFLHLSDAAELRLGKAFGMLSERHLT